jgi:uncharacterized coiled-coil DUF342 family protein
MDLLMTGKLISLIFGGLGVLFMLFTFIFNLYKMWQEKNNKLQDKIEANKVLELNDRRSITNETIRWLVSEVKEINTKLGQIFGEISEVRINQKDIIIKFQDEYLKKETHEAVCKERRSL